ncbi:MAG: FKBP-type peptidyl-prolyl cis-trans isomerase [Streptococcaceae bacterium]|jgi:FKBP-type peptidyl-prolyl cis-trans isomerase FkpA|nr:FKBP-type peptidyl-prolyl cis-trans isomerase [Streptococcaceae bacterium]
MENKNKLTHIVLLVLAAAAVALGLVYFANKPSAEKPVKTAQDNYQVFTKLVKAKKFDAEKATELKVEELKAGTGAVISENDTIEANYTGWNAKGVIFDTTKKTADSDTTPIEFPLSGVIPGWTKGLAGKKVGGIYKLTIPVDLAYGETPPTEDSAGPLQFVIEIVAKK